MKIAIVGGGMAGLSAALDLSEKGHEVYIYEKYNQLGGLASTVEIAGNQLERFYHHIFSTDLDILNLIETLGLSPELKWYEDKKGNWFEGKWYPFTTPKDVLTFKPLPLLDRIRFAVVGFYLSKVNNYRKFEDVLATEWLKKTMGEKAYKIICEPLLKAKFGNYAEQISMAWFYARVKSRFGPSKKGMPRGKLGYLNGSVRVLVDKVEEKLRGRGVKIFLNQEVKKILGNNYSVSGLETRSGIENFEKIIVTSATPLFLEIGSHLFSEDYINQVSRIKYYGSCVAIIEINQSLSPVYWMNILDETKPFLAVIEHTNMVPKKYYQNKVILYLAKYLDTSESFYKLQSAEILEYFFSQLKIIFPNFEKSLVIGTKVMRAEYTQPIVLTGHKKSIPEHRTPISGLYLCNMTQIYPEDRGMSYSIGLGSKVAKMLMEDISLK